jgi:Arc/MetJ family transcription regulator
MRTTLDIDEKLLNEAVERSGAKTKKQALDNALNDYVRRLRRESLAKRIREGDLGIDMTLEELRKLRGCE